MTFLLKQFFSLFWLLNSETATNQIAAGVACGLILGFAPTLSLQTILVVLVILFFRVQIGAAMLATFAFKFVAYLLDPVSNSLGMSILEIESLRPLFTSLYNMPLLPLTRFYNSMVMGSAALSLILALPVFFVSKILITKYRATVYQSLKQTKFWKALHATKFYGAYEKYRELY